MADEPNLYELLQVDRRASQEIIEAAYHRLARKYHPDVNTSPDAILMMQKLNNAYQVLSDPAKRADYDRRIFETSERPRKEEVKTEQQKTAPEPIACQNCGRIDETLRATVFQYVVSIVIFSFKRGGGAGILCSSCRSTRAIAYTALSLLLGIWGVPWGVLWTLEAITVNLGGGRQPSELNGPLLRSLGAYLWSIGKHAEGYEALEASLHFENNLEVKEFLERNVEARQKPHAVPTKKEAQWNRSALVSIGILAVLILLLLIPNLSSRLPGKTSDESSDGPVIYYVQSGDTLFSISRRFGTTVAAIMSANGLVSDSIYGGQRLVVPVGSSFSSPIFIPPTPTPLPSRLWVCVDIAYGHRDPYEESPILFQMSQKDGWYVDLLANPHATSDNWIAINWSASSTGLAWMKLSDLCGTPAPFSFSVDDILKIMAGPSTFRTPVPLSCGNLPPSTAGLLFINHFPGEATVTIVDHEYHVPGNSQMVIPIPAGKPFTIDAFIPGVGRYRPTLGPFTWNADECHTLEPHN